MTTAQSNCLSSKSVIRNSTFTSRPTPLSEIAGAPFRCPTVHHGTRGGGRNSANFFLPNEPNFPPWRYRKRRFPPKNEPKRTQNEPNKKPNEPKTNPNEPIVYRRRHPVPLPRTDGWHGQAKRRHALATPPRVPSRCGARGGGRNVVLCRESLLGTSGRTENGFSVQRSSVPASPSSILPTPIPNPQSAPAPCSKRMHHRLYSPPSAGGMGKLVCPCVCPVLSSRKSWGTDVRRARAGAACAPFFPAGKGGGRTCASSSITWSMTLPRTHHG